jgi:phosphatidyl-myo-inositol alpha-mannosyltransferase
VEVHVHRLANALVQHEGMQVTVLSASPKPEDALYKLQPFLSGKLGNPLAKITLAPVALNFVDFSKFDLLHTNGDDWFYLNRRLPTLRTIHGSALYEARSAKTLQRKALQYILHPLTYVSARLATIALGGGTEATALYGLEGIMDYGVDLSRFAPREKSRTPLLFYIGLWKGRKRGELAYNTFIQHVLPRYPDARLYMASDYCPEHPNVIAGGFPSNEELAKWIGEAWIFIYPSAYEGFGIPYIEAMASGTAIVTTRNSGAEYVLENGRYGIITSDADLASSIVSLLADRQRREELAAAGLRYVEKFSWPNIAARHAEIYRQVIARWNSTRHPSAH